MAEATADRRMIEGELLELENKFHITFHSNPSGMVITKLKDGEVIDINQSFKNITGYSREESIGRTSIELGFWIKPEDRELATNKMKEHHGFRDVEFEFRNKSGDIRTGLFSSAIVTIKGEPCIITSITDITERKRFEEQLIESENKYRRKSKVLSAVSEVLREVLICESEKDVGNTFLAVAEKITDSKFGFIGQINSDGLFDTIAISNPGWDACKMSDSDATRLIKGMKIRGVDRSTIREEKSRIVNDPASHPDRIGAPEGHPPVTSFLGVPLKQAGKTIGMIGLGNKESGYNLEDQQAVEDLSIAFVEALMRKRAEKEVKKSEEKYKLLAENSADVIFKINIEDERFTYVSPSVKKMLGYTVKEALSLNGQDILTEESYLKQGQLLINTLENGRMSSEILELEAVHKDGHIIPVEINASIILDEHGNPVEILGVARDITERKRAERTVEKFFEQHMNLHMIAGFGGSMRRANQGWETMLGYSKDELEGRLIYDLVHPGDLASTTKEMKKLAKGETTIYFENRYRHKNGKYRLLAWSAIASLEDQLVYGVASDITEARQAEEALQNSHERFLKVLDGIEATVYVADMESHEILFMNKNMIEQFGTDLTGERCWAVLRNEPGPCRCCTNDQLVDENGKPAGVCVWQDKNPVTKRWYNNIDRAIEWTDGRIVRLQIATDNTAFKKMEKELRQAYKMEAIGTLAGGIAHDFNNILSAVIGYTELALDDAKPGSHFEENLHEVFTAGKRARDLVRQILTFAREADEEVKPLAVYLIAREALKFLRASIPKSIEIKGKINSDSLVMADPTQLHQILMNLCTNAAYAMEDQGGVLEVGLVDVAVDKKKPQGTTQLKPGAYIKLWVSDTGTGIQPDIIDSIFDPYFTTKVPGEGTGMGLSVVHGIVNKCYGDISVESEPGKGTTFSIYLPKIKKSVEPRANQTETLPFGAERILFIDDELPIARMGSRMLERSGYRVTIRTSSVEALELFRSKPKDFDLVITDMTMPNMTGEVLAAELIAIRPDIPVILCTGYSKKISMLIRLTHKMI